MHFRELERGELLAVVGGVLLGLSLFMSWYTLGNRHALLGPCRGPHTVCTGWSALIGLRYVLLLAAVAPLILSWIVIRGHALSWPRGELTAVTAITALVFTVFRGFVDRPGGPPGEISITAGWWVALGADLLILVGSVWRAQRGARRNPPGVL